MLSKTIQDDEQAALLDESHIQDDNDTAHKVKQAKSRVSNLSPWILAFVTLIAVTDLFTLLYVFSVFRTRYKPEPAVLDLANPYIGLDDLYRTGKINATKLDPILTKPRVSGIVFRDRPGTTSPTEEHLWSDKYGTLTPHESHFHIDENTNAIVQFRAVDYGMEDCSLVLRLPKLGQKLEGSATFMMRGAAILDVSSLDTSYPIDLRSLSWRTRPARVDEHTVSDVTDGKETVLSQFPCAWGSLHAFEVGCAGDTQCAMHVRSSQNETWGLVMYQHQTI